MTHVDDGALVRYLDEECDATERAEVGEHVHGCQACAARLAELGRHAGLVSLALRAADAPATSRRPARRVGARAAVAAALIVVGVAGAVRPVRAWILERTQTLWAAVTGRNGDQDGAAPGVPPGSASVTFVPAGTEFLVEVTGPQVEGRLVIEGVPGDTATTVVMGGSGTEDVMVLPTGLRIANAATSRASYAVRLPTRLTHVVVRIGGRPERTFVPGGAPLEIDLRGP